MRTQGNQFQARKGKQNIFRTITAGRTNILFEAISGFIFALSSYPSYIVEVFLRKKFGERYFTTANGIVILGLMFFIWSKLDRIGSDYLGFSWFLFMLVFGVMVVRHRLEIQKFGTAYNFDRFSYSDGEILPFWWQIIGQKVFGVTISRYHVHILLEPALPVLIGIFLTAIPFTRGIGILITLSGLFFGFRNFMKAHMARAYVLDIIDEQISMEGKHDVLVEQKPMSETKGLSFPIELPKSRNLREEISNSIDKNPLDIWDDEFEEELDIA